MFGLPELDDVVCQRLTSQDLARCARVNKKWYAVVTPYLWSDLSCLGNSSNTQRQAFTNLVLEDYFYHQGKPETWQEGHGTDQSKQLLSSSPLSTLAKHGLWIRMLPDPHKLLRYIHTLTRQQKPAEQELLFHLFTHYHTAQVSHFCLDLERCGTDDLKEAIAKLVLPRVHHLVVRATLRDKRQGFSTLIRFLDQCSTVLEKLVLEIGIEYEEPSIMYSEYEESNGDDEGEDQAEKGQEMTEAKEWASLKELVLRPRWCIGNPETKAHWLWLYKRCGQVEKMEISRIRSADVDIMEAMLAYMPNLTEVTLGQNQNGDPRDHTSRDAQTAALLTGSRKGWKVVRLKDTVNFGHASVEALGKHFSTLEVLHMDRHSPSLSNDALVLVLSSCPNLCALIDADMSAYTDLHYYRFDSKAFTDEDPNTGVLKPWACEDSLKVLKIKIRGIPRPDLKALGSGVLEETYRGEGRDIQGIVYERLARMTNLEVLWLGSRLYESAERLKPSMDQRDCLEMSLKGGLHKLAELKKLRELSVSGMETKIGVKETQWMVEHWPRLRAIYGLKDGNHKEALKWLRARHPEIEVSRLT